MTIDFKRQFGAGPDQDASDKDEKFLAAQSRQISLENTLTGVHADDGSTTQLQRGLSGRHLNFIAIGGTIGTGFFLGSGTALAKAGPVGCLVSYIFVGTILWSVMVTLGEMATFIPTAGAFSAYATRFVDPSLGFAMGWLYWFSCMFFSPPPRRMWPPYSNMAKQGLSHMPSP